MQIHIEKKLIGLIIFEVEVKVEVEVEEIEKARLKGLTKKD